MKTNGLTRTIGVLLAVAAATCATGAYAQASDAAPADAAAQSPASAPQGRSDSTLVRNVRRAFTRTPGLNFASIHVTAHGGVVTLTGSVPHHSQIETAGNAAKSVDGVTDVSNKLTVRTRRSSGAP
jgi:hyperosmotically inducible periplasmic protein